MTFTLQGKDYEVRYKLKALLYNEQLLKNLDEDMRDTVMMQSIVMFYSFILANNEEFNMSVEDFMDALDEDPTLLPMFNAFLMEEQAKQVALLDEKKGGKDKNKKKRPSKNSTE